MTRDEVRDELEQAAAALAVVAQQISHTTGAASEEGDPLGALYFAVHHLYRAVEKLAAEDTEGA